MRQTTTDAPECDKRDAAPDDVGRFTLDLSGYHSFLDWIENESGPMLKDSAAFDGRPANVGFSLLFDELWSHGVVQPPSGFAEGRLHMVPLLGWDEMVLVIMSGSGHRVLSNYVDVDGLDAISLCDVDGRRELLEHIESAVGMPTFLLPMASEFPVDEWEEELEDGVTERRFGRYTARIALVGEWKDPAAAHHAAQHLLWNLAASPAWPEPEVVVVEDCASVTRDAAALCSVEVRASVLLAPDRGDARDRLEEYFEAAREDELVREYVVIEVVRRHHQEAQ
jgi:hypothetical protein